MSIVIIKILDFYQKIYIFHMLKYENKCMYDC